MSRGIFAVQNTHDIDAMLAPFAEDAVVRDEGHEHRGTSAGLRYHFTFERNRVACLEIG